MFAVHFFVTVLCLLSNTPRIAAQDEDKFEVRLKPEKDTIMLGEPLVFAFEVINLSGEKVCLRLGGDYRNKFGRPNSFQVTVKTHDGVEVQQPEVWDHGGFISCESISTICAFCGHSAHISCERAWKVGLSAG